MERPLLRNTQRGKNMKTPHWLAVTCFTLVVASCSPRNQEARQGQVDSKNVDAPWLEQVAGMPAEKQVEAVAARLTELNPGPICKLTHKVEKGVVTEVKLEWNRFVGSDVVDISPVRALRGARKFDCSKTLVADLSPLRGMKLTSLNCS